MPSLDEFLCLIKLEELYIPSLKRNVMGQKYKEYDISCGKCGTYVLSYHKYGAGKGILRLYLHRIAAPQALVDMYQKAEVVGEIPHLKCPECEEMLGSAVISKGQKWAFRMRQGIFHRKLKK